MSPYNARLYTAITFAWPGLVARWVAEKKSLVVEARYNARTPYIGDRCKHCAPRPAKPLGTVMMARETPVWEFVEAPSWRTILKQNHFARRQVAHDPRSTRQRFAQHAPQRCSPSCEPSPLRLPPRPRRCLWQFWRDRARRAEERSVWPLAGFRWRGHRDLPVWSGPVRPYCRDSTYPKRADSKGLGRTITVRLDDHKTSVGGPGWLLVWSYH